MHRPMPQPMVDSFRSDAAQMLAGHPLQNPMAPPTPPKKPIHKRWWFWVLVVVVLMGALGRVGGGSASNDATSGPTAPEPTATQPVAAPGDQTQAAEPPKAPATDTVKAGVGTPVEVQGVAFTIQNASTTTRLESVFGSKDGNWIVLDVLIENGTNEAITVNDSQVTLVTPTGAVYETDSDWIEYIDNERWLFLEKINPGLSKEGTVLIAVGPDVTGGTVTFKPNMFSNKKAEVEISIA